MWLCLGAEEPFFLVRLLLPELNQAPLADNFIVGQEITCRESCLDLFGELELLGFIVKYIYAHTHTHTRNYPFAYFRPVPAVHSLYWHCMTRWSFLLNYCSCCCCVISDNCPVANLGHVLNIVLSVHEQCPNQLGHIVRFKHLSLFLLFSNTFLMAIL